jgi:hypothetical protein
MRSVFHKAGWYIQIGGADKNLAAKETMVVKWSQKYCGWATQPIKAEMELYSKLKNLGLRKLVPRIYFYDGTIIAQERLWSTNLGYDNKSSHSCDKAKLLLNKYDNLIAILDAVGIDFLDSDIHDGNVGLDKRNQIKVLDGGLEFSEYVNGP